MVCAMFFRPPRVERPPRPVGQLSCRCRSRLSPATELDAQFVTFSRVLNPSTAGATGGGARPTSMEPSVSHTATANLVSWLTSRRTAGRPRPERTGPVLIISPSAIGSSATTQTAGRLSPVFLTVSMIQPDVTLRSSACQALFRNRALTSEKKRVTFH